MSKMISVGRGFWNIRGSFKLGGVMDIGTQSSLVKCKSGDFIFLDACTLSPETKSRVDRLTENGERISAIINLHPFHTVYVESLH